MRAIVESYLIDLCTDPNLLSTADDARHIERTGSVPGGWWTLKDEFSPPGFEGL